MQNGQPAVEVYHQSFGRQTMGWIITRGDRFHTVAVSNDHEFCQRLNRLEALVYLLGGMDFFYNIRERIDQGYIELSQDDQDRLKEICEGLRIKT